MPNDLTLRNSPSPIVCGISCSVLRMGMRVVAAERGLDPAALLLSLNGAVRRCLSRLADPATPD